MLQVGAAARFSTGMLLPEVGGVRWTCRGDNRDGDGVRVPWEVGLAVTNVETWSDKDDQQLGRRTECSRTLRGTGGCERNGEGPDVDAMVWRWTD